MTRCPQLLWGRGRRDPLQNTSRRAFIEKAVFAKLERGDIIIAAIAAKIEQVKLDAATLQALDHLERVERRTEQAVELSRLFSTSRRGSSIRGLFVGPEPGKKA